MQLQKSEQEILTIKFRIDANITKLNTKAKTGCAIDSLDGSCELMIIKERTPVKVISG